MSDGHQQIFENIQEGYYEYSLNKEITYLNEAACKILGYEKHDLIGSAYKKFADASIVEQVYEVFDKAHITGQPSRLEIKIIRKDGSNAFIETSISFLKDELGKIVGFHGIILDITGRKMAEKALKASERLFRSVVENSHDGITIIDDNFCMTYANDEIASILGYSREEIIGQNFQNFLDEESRQLVADRYIQRQRGEDVPRRYEFNIQRKDGQKRRVEIISSVIKDIKGKIYTVAQVLDVTEHRDAQKALEEAKTGFEALFENANELIVTTNPQGYILKVNKKVEEIFGYPRQELIGQSVLKLAHPEETAKFVRFWKEVLKGESPHYELIAVSKEGHVENLFASGSAIRKDGEIVEIRYNAQDITELKKAQETIIGIKNHLENILYSSPNLTITFDTHGKIETVNPVAVKFFQDPPHFFKGKKFSDISSYLRRFEKIIANVQRTNTPEFLHGEHLLEGRTEVFDIDIYPLAPSGIEGTVLTALDVTERKRMELKLIHAQKMETIGELAGGFAHDFNNILTGIMGNLSMMRITQDEVKHRQYLDALENISNHAKELVQKMLVLTARGEGKPESFSVHDLIEETLGIAASSIPRNIQLVFNGEGEKSEVFIDHAQFIQILMNLIINASDAISTDQGGQIVVDMSTVFIDRKSKAQNLLTKTGEFVRIEVSDNGCGIDKEILPRIFDPFFTSKTKGSKKGTGLGLSIVYNIAKNAGGSVQVYSEKGKGSQFVILLPRSRKKKTMHPRQNKKEFPSKGHGTILLVDDEAMVRDVGKDMLETLGYTVFTAKDGYECIDTLRKSDAKVDLVILDMIMPGLDGKSTLYEIEKQNIAAKVIISSGFAFDYEGGKMVSDNSIVVGRLNKPFDLYELSSALALVLT